jgi:hypothetical protein
LALLFGLFVFVLVVAVSTLAFAGYHVGLLRRRAASLHVLTPDALWRLRSEE